MAIQSLNLVARQKAQSAEIAHNEIAVDRAVEIIRERIEQIGYNLNDVAKAIERASATQASTTGAFHNFLRKSRFFTEVNAMDGTIVISDVAQDDLSDFSKRLIPMLIDGRFVMIFLCRWQMRTRRILR
ncbi:MAG: hypothetical protein P8P56_05400 [Yoonia sp.]|nr:hypothetical protein [Yoonia sp.]